MPHRPMTPPVHHHATAVAIGDRAVLIEGPPGAGKSDLALRLIDRGAVLVADDAVLLASEAGRLVASAPATIAGLIEVRGVGIVARPYRQPVAVALVVTLGGAVSRLPDPAVRTIAGIAVPTIALDACAASAPIKVELALEGLPE